MTTLPCCAIPAAQHPHCCLCRCYHHEPARHDKALCVGCDAALLKRGLRRCVIGGEVKPIAHFRRQGTWINRACYACYHRRDQERHAAKRQATIAAYLAAHREERAARERERYWSNPEPRRAAARDWAQRNRERKNAASRAYRTKNLRAQTERNRTYRSTHADRLRAARRARYQRRKLALWFGGTR